MRASLAALPESTPTSISAFDGLLFISIICVGAAAASIAMPLLWVVTPAVAALVYISARRASRVQIEIVDEGELPLHVQLALDEAIDRMPLGEPRQLLANLVRQARPLFAKRESSFDEEMERKTREDVIDMVSASCETALELWRLDGAAPKGRSPDDVLSLRYSRAREALVNRLKNAATSLSELYASDVEHGTPASDRVAELAAALRDDARARSAAKGEIDGVVGQT
ncbi:MAG: hypothetical protein ABIT20_13675 [Gemmatimonadaceae bacterium]